MSSTIKYTIIGILGVICQILVSDYINMWPLIYLTFFTSFIILLPISINKTVYLLTAFAVGLSIDIFADGVLGLNAAATVGMAFSRDLFLRLILSKSNIDNLDKSVITTGKLEISKLSVLTVLMYLVFFTIYVLLDSAGTFTFAYSILKIALCVVVNSLISILMSLTFLDKFFK